MVHYYDEHLKSVKTTALQSSPGQRQSDCGLHGSFSSRFDDINMFPRATKFPD